MYQRLSCIGVSEVLESSRKVGGGEERGRVVEGGERITETKGHIGQATKDTRPAACVCVCVWSKISYSHAYLYKYMVFSNIIQTSPRECSVKILH